MVKIRLTRMGRHKLPYYRVVVVDSKVRRDGAYIELIGTYEPIEGKVDIKKDLAIKWLNNGAQPSDTVLNIFKKEGVWKEYKENKKQSKPSKKEKNNSVKK